MKYMKIIAPPGPLRAEVQLPLSKSECNRGLMLQAYSHGAVQVDRLSEAEDSRILQHLLQSEEEVLDAGDAGTAMRFLTAYLAFRPEDRLLTGSDRMRERPIGPLVAALQELGAEIRYLDREGFPPLMIFGRNAAFRASEVELPGDISSQFLSALLMLAPGLPDGLRLHIRPPFYSRPYVEMTLSLMARFGIRYTFTDNEIHVPRQPWKAGSFTPGPDWSAASYWYGIAALHDNAEIRLPGLQADSPQGDRRIAELMRMLGVETRFDKGGALIRKAGKPSRDRVEIDFRDCPDLAQGMIAVIAGAGLQGEFTGLESLRIKETDRIQALDAELNAFGMALTEVRPGCWRLGGRFGPPSRAVKSYGDHRMAMAFAPLSLRTGPLHIADPAVVRKSYPRFWEDLRQAGFACIPVD